MFLQVLSRAKARFEMRVLAYILMPNHWHLMLWPTADLQLSQFMHWLTLTHTQRWHTVHATTGTGPLYQGRYKAIPVQSDEHLLTAIRYVERNALRAGLVKRVQDWRWSSAWERANNAVRGLIDAWPIPLPVNWLATLNEEQDDVHARTVHQAVSLNTPIGDDEWRRVTGTAFNLRRTFRSRGRPCKN